MGPALGYWPTVATKQVGARPAAWLQALGLAQEVGLHCGGRELVGSVALDYN
jgi:hypothetical protein